MVRLMTPMVALLMEGDVQMLARVAVMRSLWTVMVAVYIISYRTVVQT